MLQKRSCGVQLTKEKEKNCKPLRLTNKKIVTLKTELRQYLDSNGYLSYSAKKKKYIILGTNSPKNGLAWTVDDNSLTSNKKEVYWVLKL